MSQSDGEPACQGKTYNALKDKKHLTGINKEGVFIFASSADQKTILRLSATSLQSKMTLRIDDYW
jgi:hypothetical protein